MKRNSLLLALALFLTACSALNQANTTTTTTTDDTYYTLADAKAAPVYNQEIKAQDVSTEEPVYNQQETITTNPRAGEGIEQYNNSVVTTPATTNPATSSGNQGVATYSDTYSSGGNNITNNYYGDEYNYSSRIRRFYGPTVSVGYYDPFYSNFYYNDPFYSPSISFGLGINYGFGCYDPFYYSAFYCNPYRYYANPYFAYGGYGGFYNGYNDGYYYGGGSYSGSTKNVIYGPRTSRNGKRTSTDRTPVIGSSVPNTAAPSNVPTTITTNRNSTGNNRPMPRTLPANTSTPIGTPANTIIRNQPATGGTSATPNYTPPARTRTPDRTTTTPTDNQRVVPRTNTAPVRQEPTRNQQPARQTPSYERQSTPNYTPPPTRNSGGNGGNTTGGGAGRRGR